MAVRRGTTRGSAPTPCGRVECVEQSSARREAGRPRPSSARAQAVERPADRGQRASTRPAARGSAQLSSPRKRATGSGTGPGPGTGARGQAQGQARGQASARECRRKTWRSCGGCRGGQPPLRGRDHGPRPALVPEHADSPAEGARAVGHIRRPVGVLGGQVRRPFRWSRRVQPRGRRLEVPRSSRLGDQTCPRETPSL